MTIQYLAAAAASRQAVFGTRTFPLADGEHVISLFGEPSNIAAGKQFGVNGRPGDIYTVPEGRKLTIYQMDFQGLLLLNSDTGLTEALVSLLDSNPQGTARETVAQFYADYKKLGYLETNGEAFKWGVINEVNDIDRPFTAGRQPRCTVGGGISNASLEIFGIEGPA